MIVILIMPKRGNTSIQTMKGEYCGLCFLVRWYLVFCIHRFFFFASVPCLLHAVMSRTSQWLVLRKTELYISRVDTPLYIHKMCVSNLDELCVLSLGTLMLLLGPPIPHCGLINKLSLHKNFSCFLVKMF